MPKVDQSTRLPQWLLGVGTSSKNDDRLAEILEVLVLIGKFSFARTNESNFRNSEKMAIFLAFDLCQHPYVIWVEDRGVDLHGPSLPCDSIYYGDRSVVNSHQTGDHLMAPH